MKYIVRSFKYFAYLASPGPTTRYVPVSWNLCTTGVMCSKVKMARI